MVSACVGVGMCGIFFYIAIVEMMDKGESSAGRKCYQEKGSGSGDSLGEKNRNS